MAGTFTSLAVLILLFQVSGFAQAPSLKALADSAADRQDEIWLQDDCYMRYNRDATQPGHGTMSGIVTDRQNGWPLPNAFINLAADFLDSTGHGHSCCCYSAASDADGKYAVHDISPGYRTLTISAQGYRSETRKVTVHADEKLTADFVLAISYDKSTMSDSGAILGRVWDPVRRLPFPGATVALLDSTQTVTTDGDGVYTLKGIPAGERVLKISYPGYQTRTITRKILGGITINAGDIVLHESPDRIKNQ